LSLGYCKTFVKEIDVTSADTRTELDATLPDRFKFLGLTFFPSRDDPAAGLGTVNQCKIFNGPTSSDPVMTFLMLTGSINVLASNQGNYVMFDDTYLEFDQGLYVEVTNAEFSDAGSPFVLTLMYT